MDRIRILRLVSAEDIICNILKENADTFLIEDPLLIMVNEKRKEVSVNMQHYLPIEIIKDNQVILVKQNVMSIMKPSDSVSQFYEEMILKMHEVIVAKQKAKEQAEEDPHLMQDIMLAIEESQNSILH